MRKNKKYQIFKRAVDDLSKGFNIGDMIKANVLKEDKNIFGETLLDVNVIAYKKENDKEWTDSNYNITICEDEFEKMTIRGN